MWIISDSSPLTTQRTKPIGMLLIGAMLIAPATTAYAGEENQPNPDQKKLKRQILASLDDPEIGAELLDDEEPWFASFRISKKGPIQYRRTVQIGDDEVKLKLYGPVVRKKPGLRFKMEGLRIGDNPVFVEGFGNTKEGRIRFTIRY